MNMPKISKIKLITYLSITGERVRPFEVAKIKEHSEVIGVDLTEEEIRYIRDFMEGKLIAKDYIENE